MIMRDIGLLTVAIIVGVSSALGYYFREHIESDTAVEEAAETAIENLIEKHTGLPDGALDDVVDLSWWDDDHKDD